MSSQTDRRTRKRQATRQAISDVATALFMARGFDSVTIDEIAAAADVGRMTVFNHFPRKEDMFFDLDPEIRELLLRALRERPAAVAPAEALRRLAQRLAREGSHYLRFFEGSRRFVETVARSEALQARARAIRDEFAADIACALREEGADALREAGVDALRGAGTEASAGAGPRLFAAMAVAVLSAAFLEAHARYRANGDEAAARAVFLAMIDRGYSGVAAAMRDTPLGA